MTYKVYFEKYFNQSLTVLISRSLADPERAEDRFLEVKSFCRSFDEFPNRMKGVRSATDPLRYTWFPSGRPSLYFLAAVVDEAKLEVTFVAAGDAGRGKAGFESELKRSAD